MNRHAGTQYTLYTSTSMKLLPYFVLTYLLALFCDPSGASNILARQSIGRVNEDLHRKKQRSKPIVKRALPSTTFDFAVLNLKQSQMERNRTLERGVYQYNHESACDAVAGLNALQTFKIDNRATVTLYVNQSILIVKVLFLRRVCTEIKEVAVSSSQFLTEFIRQFIGSDEMLASLDGPSLETKVPVHCGCDNYLASFRLTHQGVYRLKIASIRSKYTAINELQLTFPPVKYDLLLDEQLTFGDSFSIKPLMQNECTWQWLSGESEKEESVGSVGDEERPTEDQLISADLPWPVQVHPGSLSWERNISQLYSRVCLSTADCAALRRCSDPMKNETAEPIAIGSTSNISETTAGYVRCSNGVGSQYCAVAIDKYHWRACDVFSTTPNASLIDSSGIKRKINPLTPSEAAAILRNKKILLAGDSHVRYFGMNLLQFACGIPATRGSPVSEVLSGPCTGLVLDVVLAAFCEPTHFGQRNEVNGYDYVMYSCGHHAAGFKHWSAEMHYTFVSDLGKLAARWNWDASNFLFMEGVASPIRNDMEAIRKQDRRTFHRINLFNQLSILALSKFNLTAVLPTFQSSLALNDKICDRGHYSSLSFIVPHLQTFLRFISL